MSTAQALALLDARILIPKISKIHDFFGYPRHLTYANKETMLTLGFTPLIK